MVLFCIVTTISSRPTPMQRYMAAQRRASVAVSE